MNFDKWIIGYLCKFMVICNVMWVWFSFVILRLNVGDGDLVFFVYFCGYFVL